MRKQLAWIIALILVWVLVTGTLSGWGETSTSPKQYKWLDVPYANASAAQKLDIYLPTDIQGPFPVIVSVHAGGYEAGDKVGPDVLTAWEGLKRGYAVVSVNYRLSGEAIFPAQINDLKAAIRFIRANARKYDLSPNKIAVWGSSAGGGLAALAGTSGNVKELKDPTLGNRYQSDRVQAVVDWCGPINFLTMDEHYKQSGIAGHLQNSPNSFGSKLMGQQITLVPDLAKMANPETYITLDDPPFFIQQGSEDKWIPMQQSTEFAAKLQAVLGKDKVECEVFQGAGHGGQRFNNPENVNKVLDFLDKNLK
ncbi:MAG: alpha/beta hydrolase [Syntrophomonas sp.]|nr:alpha/beta hydrolase [Syntrophomonas sp.]